MSNFLKVGNYTNNKPFRMKRERIKMMVLDGYERAEKEPLAAIDAKQLNMEAMMSDLTNLALSDLKNEYANHIACCEQRIAQTKEMAKNVFSPSICNPLIEEAEFQIKKFRKKMALIELLLK